MPSENRRTIESVFDVVIIGSGPVGLTMAGLLGHYGRTVAVLERHEYLYNLPRAGHIDHEIMRVLQQLGCAEKFLTDAIACDTYTLRNAKGELLAQFPWAEDGISGWPSDFMMYQPVMEDALYSHNVDDPNITFFRGAEVVELTDEGDRVTVRAEVSAAEANFNGPARNGHELVVRGRFLIGADGGRSFTRDWLGIEREDLGFSEYWMNADCRRKRPMTVEPDSGQLCDPARPTTVFPLGQRHRRFEWRVLPDEDPEKMADPAIAWELLAKLGLTEEDMSIVRLHVWKFEATIAHEWQRGRVFLVGDAAHTMPPFQGQGMCSGIRDAKNLAWKLDLVLRGVASDSLLETYQLEREPNLRAWTELSVETGRLTSTVDPAVAELRDAAYRAGETESLPSIPPMRNGILHGWHSDDSRVGVLGLQARVSRAGRTALFDDVAGTGFSIISTVGDPAAVLSPEQLAFLQELGATTAHVEAPFSKPLTAAIIDVDGSYGRYLADQGWEVVITRPDFYVFGGGLLRDLPGLVDELRSLVVAGAASAKAGAVG